MNNTCPVCGKTPETIYYNEKSQIDGCNRCIDERTADFAAKAKTPVCPTCGINFSKYDVAVFFGHGTDHIFGCDAPGCWRSYPAQWCAELTEECEVAV